MLGPKKMTAFTLVELLVVLAIFGIILLLSSGMSRRTRDTFVAQQYIKTAIQNARILRRKSMLISRNSGEKQWVQGIGFRLDKVGTQWRMIQVKALSEAINNNYFYQSFPTNNTCIDLAWNLPSTPCNNGLSLVKILNTSEQFLPEGMSFGITNSRSASPTIDTCTIALTIIYESINGKMHAYCQGSNGIDSILGSDLNDLNVKIKINYFSGDGYKLMLNLKNNGEINAIPTN